MAIDVCGGVICHSTWRMTRARLTPQDQDIRVVPNNLAAVQAILQPRRQSGKKVIGQIYASAQRLQGQGNSVTSIWVPKTTHVVLRSQAKEAAREATREGREQQKPIRAAKPTVISALRATKQNMCSLTPSIGSYTQKLDTALPEPHTRTLYDSLRREEASILAQLRTGMARLNGHLHRIAATESDQSACGDAVD